MHINDAKYREVVLYLVTHCNNQHLGKKKLLKLLYYVDFDHYQVFGTPVTNDAYQKLQYGPVPVSVDRVLNRLVSQSAIRREVHHYSRGNRQFEHNRYVPLSEPDLSIFSASELCVLKTVANRCKLMTAKAIEDATHDEAPWKMAKKIGDPIPYDSAHYRPVPIIDKSDMSHVCEKYLSKADREAIIQDLVSTQMIEGIDLSYDEAAEIVDEVFTEPFPVLR